LGAGRSRLLAALRLLILGSSGQRWTVARFRDKTALRCCDPKLNNTMPRHGGETCPERGWTLHRTKAALDWRELIGQVTMRMEASLAGALVRPIVAPDDERGPVKHQLPLSNPQSVGARKPCADPSLLTPVASNHICHPLPPPFKAGQAPYPNDREKTGEKTALKLRPKRGAWRPVL